MTVSSPARVLLIADDPQAGETYCRVLEFVGYEVSQVANFVDALATPMSDADVIVLCNLATLAYPGQAAKLSGFRRERPRTYLSPKFIDDWRRDRRSPHH